MPARAVALDVTPLLGVRTGIGTAVAGILDALAANRATLVVPYALSLAARRQQTELPPGTRLPPVPARVALRAWQHAEHPRIDRWLRPARVVHATNYLTPPSRLPTVVSVWDCSFVRFPELCTPAVRAYVPTVRRAIARGAVVHTGSHAVAEEIDAHFGPGLAAAGRIRVVPLGPPAAPVPDATPPDPWVGAIRARGPIVLAVGRHEPRKDTVSLVRAFATVGGTHPTAQLVLAGPAGPDRPAVDDAIAALTPEVRGRVHLPGAVDEAVKWQLLHGAAVLAYPSVYEGFGLPVLEAMAAGTPVAATRTGSIPEVAGDAALLVAPGDVDGLAEAIGTLLDDTTQRDARIAAGHARLALFSWEATARALGDLYEELAP